jgi:RNA polymerase sigma factor (sigma-70 family)
MERKHLPPQIQEICRMIASTRDVITSPPSPTPSELQRIAIGDRHACRELIDSWEGAIKAIASGYASRRSDLDDLMQVGRLAVYQSALKYDPSFGVPYSNYTKRAIKNSVMQEAARLARQRKLDQPLEGYNEQRTEPYRNHSVKEWVLELSEPHATIFRLLYIEKLRQRVAAEEMGVSQPRVAQLHLSFLNLARATFAG